MADARELRERRHLNRGFGAALSNAFEIAMIPAIFAFVGWWIDRLVGTHIVFVATLGLVGLVGVCLKLFYAYRFEMEKLESEGAWNRSPKQVQQ